METPLDRYDRAVAAGKAVLAGVKPEHLDDSSPCESWKVRELLNHFIGANDWFVTNMGGTPSMPNADAGPDFGSGDYNLAFAEATANARAVFAADGALDKEIQLPWGPSTGMALLGMACTDVFTHAWDLAKATGQSTDLDPELAEDLLVGCKATIQDAFRGPDSSGAPFGLEQQAGPEATAADRLAAFLGRVV